MNSCNQEGCLRLEPPHITVSLGVTSIQGNVEKRKVSNIFIHPGWNKTAYFDTDGDDLAILELESPISDWSDSIKPVCLPDIGRLPDYEKLTRTGSKVEVAGLGLVNSDSPAKTIQHATLELKENKFCQGGMFGVTGDQLCASSPNIIVCPGDSGSGLVISANTLSSDSAFTLVGVTSTGGALCSPRYSQGTFELVPTCVE